MGEIDCYNGITQHRNSEHSTNTGAIHSIYNVHVSFKCFPSCYFSLSQVYWQLKPGRHLDIKMPPYQYKDPNVMNKMVSRLSYLYNGNPHTWIDSLYIETAPCTSINLLIPGRFENNSKKWNFQTQFFNWYFEQFPWNCSQKTPTEPLWWLVNIGSGNGLVPSGNKPLPEPMLTQIYVARWHH